jgi:predicted transcriptional regulator
MSALPFWEPYGDGTSGQQGEASADSELSRRSAMPLVYTYLTDAGPSGYTSSEIEGITGLHHGIISGALSNLHRSGSIVRLKERRRRSGIYVLPMYLRDRETVPVRSNKKAGAFDDVVGRVGALIEEIGPTGSPHWDGCWKIHTPCFGEKVIGILQGRE